MEIVVVRMLMHLKKQQRSEHFQFVLLISVARYSAQSTRSQVYNTIVSYPVDYRSHVNTVIGLLEDNRPLGVSDSSGRARGFYIAAEFLPGVFRTKVVFRTCPFLKSRF